MIEMETRLLFCNRIYSINVRFMRSDVHRASIHWKKKKKLVKIKAALCSAFSFQHIWKIHLLNYYYM